MERRLRSSSEGTAGSGRMVLKPKDGHVEASSLRKPRTGSSSSKMNSLVSPRAHLQRVRSARCTWHAHISCRMNTGSKENWFPHSMLPIREAQFLLASLIHRVGRVTACRAAALPRFGGSCLVQAGLVSQQILQCRSEE